MSEILCHHCTALCCRYIALPLDRPATRREFDDMRWFLMHEGVSIFVEDGDWYISFQAACRHLLADNRCGVYETRPRVCREYSTDGCEYHGGEYNFEHHFLTPDDLAEFAEQYLKRRSGGRGRRDARGRAAAGVRARLGLLRRPARGGAEADARGVPLPILPDPPRRGAAAVPTSAAPEAAS